MNRRNFLATAALASATARPSAARNYSDYTQDPRPDVPEGTWTAGGMDGPVFQGSPVVSGPAAEAIALLQPVQRLSTGHLDYGVGEEPWQRVDGDTLALKMSRLDGTVVADVTLKA